MNPQRCDGSDSGRVGSIAGDRRSKRGWANTPVRRMWELVRGHDPPYPGSRSAFYAGVSRIRAAIQRVAIDAVVRFEGLPGEYLRMDWGEVRRMHLRVRMREATRYFFAARWKQSRYMVVQWDARHGARGAHSQPAARV